MEPSEPRRPADAPLVAVHRAQARRVSLAVVRATLAAAEAWRSSAERSRLVADAEERIDPREEERLAWWLRRAARRAAVATLGASPAIARLLEVQAQRIVSVAGRGAVTQLVRSGALLQALRERGVIAAEQAGQDVGIRGIAIADTPERLATVQAWVDDGVELISTYSRDALTGVERMIAEHARGGHTWKTLTQALQERVGMSERHAELVARDQLGKLQAAVTSDLQRQAGVTEYIWRTSRDQRVRETHAVLEGTRWRADGPGAPGAGPYGQHAHPGESIACRCYRQPVVEGVPGLTRTTRAPAPPQRAVPARPSREGVVPRAIRPPGGRPVWATE